jgi:large subunit ribosomal protein L29
MKATQYISELRALNEPELDARLKEARTELFNLRFQAATGQLENHRQIRNVRRQIAQVLTVLQGRRLGFEEVLSLETLRTREPAPATPAAAAADEAAEDETAVEPAAPEAPVAEAEAAPEAEAQAAPEGEAAGSEEAKA